MNNLKTYKFSDLYEMSSGISSKPEQAGHGSPFVSFSTVFNNQFLPDLLPDLMSTSAREKETYSIKEGDIFLTRTSETLNELGMSSVAAKDYPEASYSGFLKRLRPTQSNITYGKFMAFYLRSKLFRKTMNNNAIMTLRASLNEQIFSYLDLVLPKYEEQVKIGNLFFKINEKIILNNKINQELEAMAKLIYDYWFVQFDFPISAAYAVSVGKLDLEGKPYKSSGGKMVFNEELKREIPEGWGVGTLVDIASIRAGGDKPSNLTKTNTIENNIPIYSNGVTNEGLYGFTDKAKVLQPSITVSARGTIGYCVLRTASFVPIIRLISITPHNSSMLNYLFHCVRELTFENSGSVQKQLTVPQISKLKILVPSKRMVEMFDNIVSPMISKIDVNKTENLQLSSIRDWLLPMLMNGQVKVKD